MEGVRVFLESSTIHGLTYISTTQKCVRLFWFLVVVTGFVGAGYLIRESFASWSESPIKTTIETLPISDIKFPKVTVCPPKNTFTDFNYDLMITEKRTMTKEMQDYLFKYTLEALSIEKSFYHSNWTKLHEDHRFFNWYHGYTKMNLPFWVPESQSDGGVSIYDEDDCSDCLVIRIDTTATEGAITTQYYGEKFKSGLVERKLWYSVLVDPPESAKHNENVTLHLKVEKMSMKGLSSVSKDKFDIDFETLNDDQIVIKNFTPPGYRNFISLVRDVISEDVEQMKLNVMPGFKLSWWYTGDVVTPDTKFENMTYNKLFIRLH